MRRRTLSIQCNQCGKVVILYVKMGKGRVWHCWKKRILKDNSIKEGKHIFCSCGNLIGKDERIWLKLKQHNVNIKKK